MAYSSYQKHYLVFAQLRNIMLNVSYIIPPFSLLVNILSRHPASKISDNLIISQPATFNNMNHEVAFNALWSFTALGNVIFFAIRG